jgi:signal transduction histidine kinase/DNA-binding LacI/PurR family transcriptional regulator/CheY-like chemotaxis protein
MPEQPRPIGVFSHYLSGYYFGGMLSGIHQVARNAGVPLVVIQWPRGDQPLPIFGADQIAGWIVIHPDEGDRANLAVLCAATAPVVTAPVPLEGVMNCTFVQVDNHGGMRAAVLHLIDHGHRRIAYIDHGPDAWSRQRYQGYCDALAARGIVHDPALVMRLESSRDNFDFHYEHGEHAARYLLERGISCTALAASTDECALAAMRVLQAAGHRVPDDLAVVGFDDLVEAQYASPPLTTVRSQFDAIGRAAAEQVLAEIRGGRAAYPQVISVPTTLLVRRSCGCTTLDERLAGAGAIHATPANWQSTLIQQLVQVVRYPLPLDPAVPPDRLWPGASVLVAAIDATLHEQPPPPPASIETAWQQAIGQTENLEVLHVALTLLEDAAEQRLAATPNATTRPAVTTLLRRIRLELMRARLAYEIAPKQQLGDQVRSNHAVSMALLNSSSGDAQALRWLASTPAIWGCLGLWDDVPSAGTTTLTIVGAYQRDATPSSAVGQHVAATAFPPISQLPLSAQQGQGMTILCPIRTETCDWGVLALYGWDDQSLLTIGHGERTENLTIQANLLGTTLDRDSVLAALMQARAAAEQANQAKSTFLSNMSHELRTPLNGILGYAQILQQQRWDPAATNGLSIIQQSGEHLLTLINDILDLAKIEAGRLELSPTALQLPTFLNGIVGIIRARAEAKELMLAFEMPPSLPPWVQADETRLRQVLLNLLGNAVKFTERGSVTLHVSCRDAGRGTRDESQPPPLVTRPTSRVTFKVADTGSGIAPDQLERIFQPFEQTGELRRRAEGTGLGLAISRQLVQLMGDDLHVESALGCGSTFWFEVALPLAAAAGQAAPSHARLITGYRGSRRTLLVADDIASNRAVLSAMLQPLGFTVLEAADGRQALVLAQQTRPDLILMDRRMPVLSGPAAVQQIRTLPDVRGIPIIATSASVAAADQALSREAGYDAFLPKPIDWPRLAALLEQYLQLDWVYAAEPAADEEPAALAPPPPDELTILFELAAIGDLLGVQARAAQLEQGDVALRPFAQRLARLASQFEAEQVQALIARYR